MIKKRNKKVPPLPRSKTRHPRRQSNSDSSESSTNTKPRDPKKLATGSLLGFYRHLRNKSREDLANAAKISVSMLGMVENGTRLPTKEVLESLGQALELGAYQRLQLHAIAGFSAQISESPGWEVRADDVISGVPLFLRSMGVESKFQESLDIDEAWIVTRRPLALDEPVLSMLKSKLLNTDASYVYFVDSRTGAHDFRTLWHRLDLVSDHDWIQKTKDRAASGKSEQLKVVLSPPTLCASTHTISLFNPRSETKARFGRAAYYGGGMPIGVYPLDRVLYEQLVGVLKEVYVDCERSPGKTFPRDTTMWGGFCLQTYRDVESA
jgi:transcriptional regulator with XRE-family HTH domain